MKIFFINGLLSIMFFCVGYVFVDFLLEKGIIPVEKGIIPEGGLADMFGKDDSVSFSQHYDAGMYSDFNLNHTRSEVKMVSENEAEVISYYEVVVNGERYEVSGRMTYIFK